MHLELGALTLCPVIRRLDLERHLRHHRCALLREGGRHSVWTDASGRRRVTVPRHREIPHTTARAICDQLGVPPLGRQVSFPQP